MLRTFLYTRARPVLLVAGLALLAGCPRSPSEGDGTPVAAPAQQAPVAGPAADPPSQPPIDPVVSCNTTSTVRTLGALHEAGLLKKARGVLVRRATDPWESDHSGIMNTVVPERVIPSHQGPDARTVMPELDVVTIAAKAAHTQGHGHFWIAELTREASRDEVLDAFRAAPRIALMRMGDGIVALNSTIELMRDLHRPRGDMWEVALWEDVLTVEGNELYYAYQVDNQAIVVPETIDALRALTATADAGESMRLTDETLGLTDDFLRPQARALAPA